MGALVRTHRKTAKDLQHAHLLRKRDPPARFLSNLAGGRGLLMREKVMDILNMVVRTQPTRSRPSRDRGITGLSRGPTAWDGPP